MRSMTETSSRSRVRSICRAAARWIEHVLAAVGGLVLLSWLTIDVSTVISPSMAPTLQGNNVDDGDRVLTEKVTRWFRHPRRWEVITFHTPEGQKRMKRVVGLPGETVQLNESGSLLIDGQSVALPETLDVKYLRYGNLVDGKAVPCGEGYFVLGDFLRDSDDSRFEGSVSPDAVIGRAWLKLWPWTRFGFVR
jgi:signal peptidase I